MVNKRWSEPRKESLASLLAEAGFEDVDSTPEHLRVFAEIAASSRSGAVSAMRAFLDLVKGSRSGDGVEFINLAPWERCSRCGRVGKAGELSRLPIEKLIQLVELIRQFGEIEPVMFQEFPWMQSDSSPSTESDDS